MTKKSRTTQTSARAKKAAEEFGRELTNSRSGKVSCIGKQNQGSQNIFVNKQATKKKINNQIQSGFSPTVVANKLEKVSELSDSVKKQLALVHQEMSKRNLSACKKAPLVGEPNRCPKKGKITWDDEANGVGGATLPNLVTENDAGTTDEDCEDVQKNKEDYNKLDSQLDDVLSQLHWDVKTNTVKKDLDDAWSPPYANDRVRQSMEERLVGVVKMFQENKKIDRNDIINRNPELGSKKFGSTTNKIAVGIAALAAYQYVHGKTGIFPKKGQPLKLNDLEPDAKKEMAKNFIRDVLAPLDKDVAKGKASVDSCVEKAMRLNIRNMRENIRKKLSRHGVWHPSKMENLTDSNTNGVYLCHFVAYARLDGTVSKLALRGEAPVVGSNNTTEQSE